MATEVWLSATSLIGVALGGALSFLVQHTTQRSAERAEQRRQAHEVTESRRAERLARLERFVEVAAYLEANRLAFLDAGRAAVG
jgi:hypothetical protein